VNAYSLGLATLMLLGGAAGDYYGRRRVFFIGIAIFTIASIVCGIAANASQLVAARAIQGIGGALLIPSNLAIIGAVFDEGERGKAIGTWAALSAVTAAAGPVLGGWLIDTVSWRAIFFLNVPIALATLVIAWRFVPETRNPDSACKLDWRGATLITVALLTLALGLTKAGTLGWRDPLVIASLVVALIFLGAFITTQRHSANPMIPLSLFQSRNFNGANLLTLLLYTALAGVYFLLPFNLIHVQKFTAAATGAVFLPVTIFVAGLSRWSGALHGRIGAKWPLIGGPIITAVGCALLAWTGGDGSYWTDFLPPMIAVGLGVGIIVSPLTASVLSSVSSSTSGIASGINNSVEEVSSLLAVALFGTIALLLYQQALSSHLLLAGLDASDVALAVGEIGRTLAGSDIPAFVPERYRSGFEAAANAAFIDSFRTMMLTASGIAVLSALAAAAIFDSQPKRVMSDSQRKLDGTAGGPPAEAQNKTDSTPENAVAETKPVITREEITMTCGDPS
jgi:EmrB/QacA subfamily drug resistance transporter